MKFIKPKFINTSLAVIILSLPLLKERVQLPTGEFVDERYIPFHLIFTYLQMRDYFPFVQMIGFSLFVYFVVSVVVATIMCCLHYI